MAILKEQNPSTTTLPSPVAIRYPVHRPHHVVLIPGDGIGPEVAEATVRAVEATGISVEWKRIELNAKTIAEDGGVLPNTVLEALGRRRVALKGPVGTPIGGGFRSVNLALRKELNLFANVRPVPDVGRTASTADFTDAVIRHLELPAAA